MIYLVILLWLLGAISSAVAAKEAFDSMENRATKIAASMITLVIWPFCVLIGLAKVAVTITRNTRR